MKIRQRRPSGRVRGVLVDVVKAGRMPAELLSPPERAALMAACVADGMTDQEIAERTRWSLYTVARLRSELGLPRNPDPDRSPAR